MKSSFLLFVFTLTLFSFNVLGQITAEETLFNDTTSFKGRTTIGGYGNAVYQRDFNAELSTVNLERFVLFIGHKFSKKISFFSELELEDAKIEGGDQGGELALEQCYIQFNLNKTHYLVAGLFLPRIGILNENHLPTSFNGNERAQVEQWIIPSTWRELGVCLYGRFNQLPLSYSIGLMNGLNSAKFEHSSGIREGRFSGSNASANNIAVAGALQLYKNNLKLQLSGYYGGSVGLAPHQADSLKLTSGFFGTPVGVVEANLQYSINGFSIRILGTSLAIPDDPELADSLLDAAKFYVQTLQVPARRNVTDPEVVRGKNVFIDAKCNSCHIATMTTAVNVAFTYVSNQTLHPYTDLLLHDMGQGLSDNRPDFLADGNEWRTTPLWGVGLIEKVNFPGYYLHDGRARTLIEAIMWHGGEAEESKNYVSHLSTSDRNALISFLKSL